MMMGTQATYRSPVDCREVAMVIKTGTKLAEIEKTVIVETLRAQNFNRTHTARTLGIGIRRLQRKLKQYGLTGFGLEGRYDFAPHFDGMGMDALASSI